MYLNYPHPTFAKIRATRLSENVLLTSLGSDVKREFEIEEKFLIGGQDKIKVVIVDKLEIIQLLLNTIRSLHKSNITQSDGCMR